MNYKELESLYAAGRLSRRDFLAGAAAVGALGAAATLPGGGAQAATPKKGGDLRVALGHGSTTDSLDPATYENDFMIILDYATHNHLGEVLASGEIIPELAESWETEDAKTWAVHMRQGVTFHNGQEVTAEDVIASMRHHMGETKSAAKSLLKQIKSMKTDGKYTVIFDLEAPNADFMYIASDYHVPIKPSKDGKIDPTDGIGAGPFVLQDFEPGVRGYFTRFKDYWKSDRAHFDSVEINAIHDQAARTNALTTGEVDVIDRVDLKTVHLMKKRPGVVVEEVVGFRHYTFPMRTDMDPYTDNQVRLALKHALDREALVETVLRGHGRVGNDHPISPSNRFHADDLEQRTFDPDKAKFHMKKAGLDNVTFNLSAADAAFPGAVDAAVLYQEHAKKAGIDINVVREPNDGYWSDVWMNKAWCACYWSGRVTADWMFSTTYAAGADWNDTFWEHERFNKLLVEARGITDQAKRQEMYSEMQQILRDEGGTVVPMFANYVFAHSDKVQHDGELAGNWVLDGQKFTERWWFA